jgi:hypothetical protein
MVLVISHTCFTSRTCALLGLDFMLRPLRSLTSHCKIFHQQRTCTVAAGCIWSDHVGSCQAVCRQPVPWEDFRGWNDSWLKSQLQEKSFVIYDCTIIMILLNCDICWYMLIYADIIYIYININMYVCWYSNSCNHPWSNFNLQDLTSVSFRRPGQNYFASLEMSSLWDCELEKGIRPVLPEVSQRNNTGTA